MKANALRATAGIHHLEEELFPDQVVPLVLTFVVFVGGIAVLFAEIWLLNHFVIAREPVILHLRWQDILVGTTIYLKTSIDFAIFIGRLMSVYPGWKNRIAIEVGTALGNILGTLGILILWDLFREVPLLMAVMIVLAALVLLRMAEEGLEHAQDSEGNFLIKLGGVEKVYAKVLRSVNMVFAPLLNRLVPKISVKSEGKQALRSLFILAVSVPFILGLDDFAGYIPLFNIVNVFGFATGVFLGHMVLNIALFLSPKTTIKAVKTPIISFVGSVAFVGLALWGLVEVAKLLMH